MIEIANLEEWTKEYFSDPENQKKAEKACERYDRLMVKNIKRQINEIAAIYDWDMEVNTTDPDFYKWTSGFL